MTFKTLKYVEQNQIGILSINRPEALNALNKSVIDELYVWFENEISQPKVRCVILTGEGDKSFVAGADIKEMENYDEKEALTLSLRGQKLLQMIEDAPIPFIGAINGFALGGGLELALSCSFLIASEKARVGLPEVTLGLIPGYGGTQRLERYIGKAGARFMSLTGDVFTAQQAKELGLFAEVVPHESLQERALHWATKIAARGPVAVRKAKEAINRGSDLSQVDGLALEARLFSETFLTKDKKEGIKAFIEKRAPIFEGK